MSEKALIRSRLPCIPLYTIPELSLTVTGAPMISLKKPLGSLESLAASGAGLSPLVDMMTLIAAGELPGHLEDGNGGGSRCGGCGGTVPIALRRDKTVIVRQGEFVVNAQTAQTTSPRKWEARAGDFASAPPARVTPPSLHTTRHLHFDWRETATTS
jgi:hypothetical protein